MATVKPSPTDPKTKALDAIWSRNLFDTLQLKGVWTVPRSGLTFQKIDGKTFELIVVMPWLDEMAKAAEEGHDVPKSKEELIDYQLMEFDLVKDRFGLAGINVVGREKIS